MEEKLATDVQHSFKSGTAYELTMMKNYIRTNKANYKLYRYQYAQKQNTFAFMPATTPCLKTHESKGS